MKKKMSILFIFILLLVVGVGCSNSGEKSPATTNNEDPSSSEESQFVEYGVAGNIVEITANEDEAIIGSIKVEGSKDNGATYSEAVVTITADTKIYINNLTNFDNLEIGMYVNVFFEGPVAESFPVQATAKQINIVPDDSNEDAESPNETADDISDNEAESDG